MLLFFPCTAEPVWAFEGAVRLLSRKWHIFQVVYDGHQPENPGDFTSVEQSVDEVGGIPESTRRCPFGRRLRLLAERNVSDMPAGYGRDSCPPGDHRRRDYSLSVSAAQTASGAGCAGLQNGCEQPQDSGSRFSAGAL